MSVLQKLTLRHLRMNRRRTAMTVIGIALSVAMVTAVSGMVVSFQDLLYRESVLQDGLWHVRYSGVSEETAQQVVQEPVFSEWEWIDTDDGPVLSLLFDRLHRGIFDESEAVCQKYDISADQVRYHNNLLIAKGIVPGPYYTALYAFAGILLSLIAIGSVLVISNAFTISSDQRSLQFGLLKSAGATSNQIRGMVLFEGVALTVISLPVGLAAGIFAQWVALSIANHILNRIPTVNIDEIFRVDTSPAAICVTIVAAFATVLLAAWFPARRAARISAIDAVRQTGRIKLSKKDVRVSRLTRRLFGTEGVLAAKTMGRNRGKYRAAVLSLVVSVVLFIGVSSFADILVKATTIMYEDTGSNVMITLNGSSAQHHDDLAVELAGWDGAQVYPSRTVSGSTVLPDQALTREYRQNFGDTVPELQLFSIGREAFNTLRGNAGASAESAKDTGSIDAILVNTTGTWIEQGRRIYFTPYALSAGDSLTASVNGQDVTLNLAGVTTEIPPGIYAKFRASSLNLIVSDETLSRLWQGDTEDFLLLAVLAEDAQAFSEQASQLLEQELAFHTWSLLNYEEVASNNRNIVLLVMIFVYGFIAMLTLIGVTSVITTVSTSIALRTREFAMLRSVGMTQASMKKMLCYESLLYGIRSLVMGIPLGLLTCLLLYQAMTSVMDFPFIWPVQSVVISIVAVLLITLATMLFAARKQQHINISQALRDDVV